MDLNNVSAAEYVKNIKDAINANQYAHEFYFPGAKAARKRQNLRLAREIGVGLGSYPEKVAIDISKTLYSNIIVRFSFDSVGVCINNSEFIRELHSGMMRWAVVLIIDGNNTAYRALHTVQLSHHGKDTSILFGVMRMIYTMIKKWHPRSVIVCFDGGTPPYRKRLVPTYKAHRTKDESVDWGTVYGQMDELCDMILPIHGILTIRRKYCEADDLMYHAAKMVQDRPYIVTTDADLLQAVDLRVCVINPSTGKVFSADTFRRFTGLNWGAYLPYKVLFGDSSDGIPGVRWIGKKTAIKLVNFWINVSPSYDYDELCLDIDNFGILNKRQLESLLSFGSERYCDAYNCMDLSIDRCGAHYSILDAQWNEADYDGIRRILLANGFSSLLEQGAEYTGSFSRLERPEFDNTVRHPVVKL